MIIIFFNLYIFYLWKKNYNNIKSSHKKIKKIKRNNYYFLTKTIKNYIERRKKDNGI